MSQSFVIQGGKPLHGSVRLGGAKNASFKLMIASLLCPDESQLLNFSHIKDVEITKHIIKELGAEVTSAGERTTFISSAQLSSFEIPERFGALSRASTMFLGPLLARFGKAVVPYPGGDAIGRRPIERHLFGLERLGVQIQQTDTHIIATAPNGLHGGEYTFEKNTHTGTETVIMAAVTANGKTVLRNVALEPEVDDLIEFLNNMGARIRRTGHRVIEIEGVSTLHSTIHKVMPDRNEAVSYACAAIATKGDIIVENARAQDLSAFLEKVEEAGGGYETGSYGIRFYYKGPLVATDVVTKPHPGFMTDWQPLWAVALTQAQGKSTIHETVSESRFQYVPDLQKMGATIELFQPTVADPETEYNFNIEPEVLRQYHAIAISGASELKGGQFAIADLRAGATLTLAGLVAKGQTVLHNVEYIDRGYERLDERLREMGAHITRRETDE